MSRREIYKDKLQFDYFSDSYIKFEEDFYKYSAMDVLLTFLTDDILREMALSQKTISSLIRKIAKTDEITFSTLKLK